MQDVLLNIEGQLLKFSHLTGSGSYALAQRLNFKMAILGLALQQINDLKKDDAGAVAKKEPTMLIIEILATYASVIRQNKLMGDALRDDVKGSIEDLIRSIHKYRDLIPKWDEGLRRTTNSQTTCMLIIVDVVSQRAFDISIKQPKNFYTFKTLSSDSLLPVRVEIIDAMNRKWIYHRDSHRVITFDIDGKDLNLELKHGNDILMNTLFTAVTSLLADEEQKWSRIRRLLPNRPDIF